MRAGNSSYCLRRQLLTPERMVPFPSVRWIVPSPQRYEKSVTCHSPALEKRVLCPLPASDLCRGSTCISTGRLRLVRPDALRCSLAEDLIKEITHPSRLRCRDAVPPSQVVIQDMYLVVKAEDVPQRNPVDTLRRSQTVHLMSEDMS